MAVAGRPRATYRLVAMHGWDDMIFTHISVRCRAGASFSDQSYGMLFEEITASSLVKIDLEGNIVMDSPYFVNPAGFTIHSAIHSAREDAQCVLHLHTDDGVAVSAQKDGLQPITQQSMLLTSQVAYHDYEGVALDLDERERLVADIGDKKLMVCAITAHWRSVKTARWPLLQFISLSAPARRKSAP